MRTIARWCVVVAVLAVGARVFAQDASAPRPLRELLEPIRARYGLPALGAAVITTEGIEALGACGTRRAGRQEPVTVEDRWHLGSCTKAMTATLVARLVERGRLRWTTTLGEALPDLKESMDPGWRGVTLEQLLTNRGGAPAGLDRDGLWGRLWRHVGTPTAARRAMAEGVLKYPPEYEPGSKMLYSNTNFALAGHVAETVTGVAWEDLMRREVFGPLGITSAGFGAPGTAGSDADQPRGHDRNGKPVEPGPGADNPAAIGPAGIVYMSLPDWGRFIAAHLRGASGEPVTDAEGKPYLAPESWTKLHTPPADGYAMGWGVAARPWAKGQGPVARGRVLTHSGSNTMWFCVTWLAPEKGFAVLVTTNTAAGDAAKATDEAAWALIQDRLKRADGK
jgi:D-alanyl-D-alanine carboxypeptidase